MRKPIIGILGNTYKTQPGLFSSAERMYVNSDYIESVLNNGGIPMAIPAVAMKADPEGSKRDGNAYAWHLQRNSVFKCPVRR